MIIAADPPAIVRYAEAHTLAPVTCAPITVVWEPHDALVASYRALAPDATNDVLAYTLLGSCTVVVPSDRDPSDQCGALIHELGHLAGLPHSTDPTSPMFPTLVVYAGCQQFDESVETLRFLLRPDNVRVPTRNCVVKKDSYVCKHFTARYYRRFGWRVEVGEAEYA